MSDTSEFRNNPQNFLKHHRIVMAELMAEVGDFAFVEENEGNDQYKIKQVLYLDFRITPGDDGTLGVKRLEVIASAVETGLRVLPWKPSALTYMKLDDSAKWFLTGPIEGCFIYIAKNAQGTPYVFHVNANALSGLQNIAAKDNAVRTILTRKNLQVGHRLEYSDYNNPGFVNKGFVYGWKEGTNWRFHVHSLSLVGKNIVTKLGYKVFEPRRYDKYIASEALPPCNVL